MMNIRNWVVGFAITTWAAIEEASRVRRLDAADAAEWRQSDWQQLGEALVPVLAVAMVVASGLAMSVHLLGPLGLIAAPAVFGFVVALAVRENWSLRTERGLRIALQRLRERHVAGENLRQADVGILQVDHAGDARVA